MARQKAPEGETPEGKFKRIAGLRTSNVVAGIELLGTMGPEVPSDAYRAQAFGAIKAAMADAEAKWATKEAPAKKRVFSFGELDDSQTVIPQTQPTPTPPAKNGSKSK